MYEPYFHHETGNNQKIINEQCSADIDAIAAINLKASFTNKILKKYTFATKYNDALLDNFAENFECTVLGKQRQAQEEVKV